jgi:DNA-binding NarL/FixJ family response regulator
MQVSLALVWRELVSSVVSVVDGFFTETRCGLVLAPLRNGSERHLEGRRLTIVEALLCGTVQKRIAIELGVAPSTVALNARKGLESLGAFGQPSRAHPLLMLAATAARAGDARAVASVAHLAGDLRIIGIPRPDRKLVGVLPKAELEVVRCLVEGRCYAEIARGRRASPRTVANQIAAAFKRLRVSGRSELIQRLFALEGAVGPVTPPPAPPPRPPTVPPPSTVRYPRSRASRESGVRPLLRLGPDPQRSLVSSRGA